jgi:hypothetical protein
MTITQALKEKNKKIGLITKLQERLRQYNSVERGAVREYDPRKVLEELKGEINALVVLKHRIHTASAEVRDKIFLQSELKNFISQLKCVPTATGVIRDRYSREEPVHVEAVISRSEMDVMLESLEKQVESIQEELDQYNHTTKI